MRQVLELALEAFEWNYNTDLDNIPACEKWAKMLKENITAIKEALAQPEQEPVVWMYQDKSTHEVKFQKHMRDFVDHGQTYETPLYTTPPQRTWVGLTDDDDIDWEEGGNLKDLVKAIEAKLKEKNI